MQKKFRNILALAAILCVALSISVTTLLAQMSSSSPILYVDPPKIEDPTILPSDTITIRIMLSSVTNMKNCTFNFTFSPDMLSVLGIIELKVQDQYPQTKMDVNSDAGYFWVSLSYKNAVTINTDTALIEIEFYVRDFGITSLHFQSSELLDNAGQPIPHETSDGLVMIFMRNIVVKEISLPYGETYVGRIIPINVTALNDGTIPENFTISLFYDTTIIEAKDVIDLQPKENITLIFNWNTGFVAPRMTPYTIKAEASILPYETNTTDNTLIDGTIKLKIVGDVNGDGTVDINDLIAWDQAYGTHAGEPNWNEQADINVDNIVDEADASLILEHYREHL